MVRHTQQVGWAMSCYLRQAAMVLSAVLVAAIVLGGATSNAAARSTKIVSLSSTGQIGDGPSGGPELAPALSSDGRYVSFTSAASNLVPDITNNVLDVFVRDEVKGTTTRVSVDSLGREANDESRRSAISADGRYVAFESQASNLVPGDTNFARDIFVHDLVTRQTTRVSLSSDGEQGNGSSMWPSISADGRYVAFMSWATNLVPGDTNGVPDIFVHDRETTETTRVSVGIGGIKANAGSFAPSISGDGRHVAFESRATNLVPDDTNDSSDVFVRDLEAGTTVRVSVDGDGEEGNDHSQTPAISGDGRFVAFESLASNLVPDDTNGTWDVLVHDLEVGNTVRVSVGTDGTEGNAASVFPAISANGSTVAFASAATNLVDGDTNDAWDVFLHDLGLGTTTRASVSSEGMQGNADSVAPALGADSSLVAFASDATNLVPEDTRGLIQIYTHAPETICPDGTRPAGPVSGLIHEEIGPAAEPARPALHQLNCNVLVPAGL